MNNAYKIGWVLAFGATANFRITPMVEREYGPDGKCINPTQVITPEDEDYQCPIEAYEKQFGKKF